jgi:hypothetical protein
LLAGCATPEKPSPAVSGNFDLDRSTIVHVQLAQEHTRLNYFKPKTKAEAAGDYWSKEVVQEFAAGEWAILALPVVLPLASLFGSVRGLSQQTLAGCEQAITKVATNQTFAATLSSELVHLGNRHTGHQWLAGAPAAGASNALVIELSISTFALTPAKRSTGEDTGNGEPTNPGMRLVGVVQCITYLAGKPEKWMPHRVAHTSDKHQFKTWAAHDAKLLREAMGVAPHELARAIMKDLFAIDAEPSSR